MTNANLNAIKGSRISQKMMEVFIKRTKNKSGAEKFQIGVISVASLAVGFIETMMNPLYPDSKKKLASDIINLILQMLEQRENQRKEKLNPVGAH